MSPQHSFDRESQHKHSQSAPSMDPNVMAAQMAEMYARLAALESEAQMWKQRSTSAEAEAQALKQWVGGGVERLHTVGRHADRVKYDLAENKITGAHVHYGLNFAIYGDMNYDKLFANGDNKHGQWGIGGRLHGGKVWSVPLVGILYFWENDLQVESIYTNLASQCVFWRTKKHEVYGSGNNRWGQLGQPGDSQLHTPELIPALSNRNIIDIQSCTWYSTALCGMAQSTQSLIERTLLKEHGIERDVSSVIIAFCEERCVLRTVFQSGHNGVWQEMHELSGKYITKMAVSMDHVLFLERDGRLWCKPTPPPFGNRAYSGKDHDDTLFQVLPDADICWKAIECGWEHTLALDDQNRAFLWEHSRARCAWDKPRRLLKHQRVTQIGCGANHSMLKTDAGQFYVLGDDAHGQCFGLAEDTSDESGDIDTTDDDDDDEDEEVTYTRLMSPSPMDEQDVCSASRAKRKVRSPRNINRIIQERYHAQAVVESVRLGCNVTSFTIRTPKPHY